MTDLKEKVPDGTTVYEIGKLLEQVLLELSKRNDRRPASPWLTTDDAAAYLRMTPSGVRTLVARGLLTPDGRGARRGYVFKTTTLDAHLARGLHAAVKPRASAAPATRARLPSGDDDVRPSRAPARTLRDIVRVDANQPVSNPTELGSAVRNATGRGR